MLVLSPKYGENKYLLYRYTMTASEIITRYIKETDALHCGILSKNIVRAMDANFFHQIFKGHKKQIYSEFSHSNKMFDSKCSALYGKGCYFRLTCCCHIILVS